jgi:hypothetical protein
MAATAGDRCPVCSSTLAPDQRYCVECGQRLPHARPAFMSDASQAAPAAPPPRKSRFGWSPNGVLIAGIGTLLLAMGVGVLIGHYAAEGSTPKHTAATPIIVPSTGGTGATGTGASAETPTGSTGGSAAGHGASHSASAGGGTAHPSQGGTKPPNPTVQLGQHGSGQGYQHHEFTGHFFGKENEENAGEEGEEGSSSGGKKK